MVSPNIQPTPVTPLEPLLTSNIRLPNADMDIHTAPAMMPTLSQGSTSSMSMHDLSRLAQSFDASPPAIQTYLLFQLMKRSARSTLQYLTMLTLERIHVDFLTELPNELAVHVLKFLDAKALCRIAQVNKTWREIGDKSSRVWYNRIVHDGLCDEADMNSPPPPEWETPEFWGHRGQPGEIEMEEPPPVPQVSTPLYAYQPLPQDHIHHPQHQAHVIPQPPQIPGTVPLPHHNLNVHQYPVINGPLPDDHEQDLDDHDDLQVDDPLPNHANHPYKFRYKKLWLLDRAWRKGTCRRLTFAASAGRVVTCLYLAGDRIVSGSDDATIVVWDARTGQCIRRLYGHEGGIWALEVFGDTIVTGSTDRSVRVWNQNTGRCTHLFWGHGSTVRSMKIMLPKLQPDGRRIPEQPIIITGGRDHTVRIWRLPNPNTDTPYLPPPTTVENGPFWMHTFTGHAGSVRAVDGWGRYVVSASYDHTIGVWDIMNGQRRHVLIGHTAKVYSVSVEEGGKRCASGGMDNTVRLWNLEDSSGLLILEGHTSLVGLLQLTPLQIISAAADSTLRIWDSASGEPITVMLGHMGAITCFHAKYGRLVSGSDGTLKLWDLPKGKNHRPANNERYVIGLGVIRDGFVRNLLDRVNGVWQIRFDRSRCVAVVQRESTTWFEIMDFSPFTHT